MSSAVFLLCEIRFLLRKMRLIGQKELVKTAVDVEILTVTAVISFCEQDIGWTKRVGKNDCKD